MSTVETSTLRPLPHERLDAYTVALELCQLVGTLGASRGAGAALEQLRRASGSVALNIAESSGTRGPDRRRYVRIARGSALESAAALDVLAALRALSPVTRRRGRELCARLYAMLTRLERRCDA